MLTFRHAKLAPALAAIAGWSSFAGATATLGVDAETLNELLGATVPGQVELALPTGGTLAVLLEDFRVTGFDPAAGKGSDGHILTAVRVKIPDLGISAPVEPRLSLRVVDVGGQPSVELRFERAEISLPLLGKYNIGALIPPTRYPAESLFAVQGVDGEVPMLGRLTDVSMGVKILRFEFELKRLEDGR